jgi:hypothetical protein
MANDLQILVFVSVINIISSLDIFHFQSIYSRVKNKLLPRIRTFREITFFILCVTIEIPKVILNA